MRPGSATKRSELWIPLIQCAWCRGIKLGERYVRVPWLKLMSGQWRIALPWIPPVVATLTHSVCAGCAGKLAERAAVKRKMWALTHATRETPTADSAAERGDEEIEEVRRAA